MFFLMQCRHHPGKNIDRDAVRPAHRDWVKAGGNGLASVLIGGALLDDAGENIGNFGILESEDEASAQAFAEGDPFARADIVSEISLTRMADSFQDWRITERMTIE